MHQKPFLKWPGGKFRLLDKILPTLPEGRRLVEPFVGSGAVFLNAPFKFALVCDLNGVLIDLFSFLKRDGESFIQRCRELFVSRNNTPDAFYRLRQRFNVSQDAEEKSVILLYLNRHAYNGLMRYNSSGGYNVPFGRYACPYFPENEMLAFVRKFDVCDVEFQKWDFRRTFCSLKSGDVVYGDPPYVPLSKTANFTSYAGNVFGDADQKALAEASIEAATRGIPVVLSNHDTSFTRELYTGARVDSFHVQRFISCNGGKRNAAPELMAVFS